MLLLGLALALATNHREDEAKEDAKSVDIYSRCVRMRLRVTNHDLSTRNDDTRRHFDTVVAQALVLTMRWRVLVWRLSKRWRES